MANGRKLSTSRSERYLGSLGYSHGQGTAAAASASEFGEDDVWSVGDVDSASGDDRAGSGEWVFSRASAPSHGGRRPPPPADHHRHHQTGGLSVAFDDPSGTAPQRIVHQLFRPDSPRGGRQLATSAPVDVPDWSKMYRVDSVDSFPDWDDGSDDSEMVPPHEYLARSRKMAANSVFEGVGRTLKGRDLSRVRDAVWSQTGFDG